MSRTYALSLIFTSLTLIGGLFYGQYWYLTELEAESSVRYRDVNNLLITQQSNAIRALRSGMQQRLADDSKARFRPMLLIFKIADDEEQELVGLFNKSIDFPKQVSVESMRDQTMESISSLVSAWTDDLHDKYENYNLSKSDLEDRITRYDDLVESAEANIHNFRYSNPQSERDLLMLIYLSTTQEILFEISAMGTTCNFVVDQYFPILIDPFHHLAPGQQTKIRVGIGSYSSSLNPDNVKMTVNGEPIKISYDGVAEYKLISRSSKKQQLKMECEITNPLTGETQRGSSIYWYNR